MMPTDPHEPPGRNSAPGMNIESVYATTVMTRSGQGPAMFEVAGPSQT